MKDRVAIVGFCDTSRNYTPYDDPRYEVWGLNRGYIFMPRSDRWFDLHSPTIRGWAHRRPDGHMQWLAKYSGPVYLHETDPDIPNSVAFPLKEVTENIGTDFWRINAEGDRKSAKELPYFDSSIAYEVALAIHEGFKEIAVYGVDLNTAGEYIWQRSGVSYLLGLAQGRGIEVILPDNCPLLTGPLYGRGFLAPEGEQMSIPQMETRLRSLTAERDDVVKELGTVEGARKELAEFVLPQMPPGLDHEKMSERLRKMDGVLAELRARLFRVEGGLKETMYWMHQTPGGEDPEQALHNLEEKLLGHRQDQQLSEGSMDIHDMIEDEPMPLKG